MTTEENPLHGRFDEIVESLMRPAPPPPSATLRVAVLYSDDGWLEQAVRDGGLEMTYSHNPTSYREIFDFGDIPFFDIVIAAMPDTRRKRHEALQFVMRFLRVRRPDTFLLVGTEQLGDAKFLSIVEQETNPYGYEVISIGKESGIFSDDDPLAFVVGMLYLDPSGLPIFSSNWKDDDNQGSALQVMIGRTARAISGQGWV